MKLTKSKLKQIIKEEILKEISGTTGGTAAIKRQKTAKADTKTKKADKTSKKSAWDTAKSTYNTKNAALTTKQSTLDTKDSELTAFAGIKYRKSNPRAKGGYDYSSTAARGYTLNPGWTLKNNARTSAESDRNTARSEKISAQSDRDTKQTSYDKAVDNLTKAEKAEMEIKAQTGFAVSAGGGGRAGGKGGTAKKGKKKESVFDILGRDLIKELKNLEKYNKK